MIEANEIKENLKQFTGTEYYYQNVFGIKYTDGIKYLAESCECYWLIDAVASWQFDEKVKLEEFQVFKLKVKSDKSAILNIEDGNYNIVAFQELEFTDFPLDEIELWFSNGVCYLPSEH
jgi:hypothetical protein